MRQVMTTFLWSALLCAKAQPMSSNWHPNVDQKNPGLNSNGNSSPAKSDSSQRGFKRTIVPAL